MGSCALPFTACSLFFPIVVDDSALKTAPKSTKIYLQASVFSKIFPEVSLPELLRKEEEKGLGGMGLSNGGPCESIRWGKKSEWYKSSIKNS